MLLFTRSRLLWSVVILAILMISAGIFMATESRAQDSFFTPGTVDAPAANLSTAFSFQGQVADENGTPVEGNCDFRFRLYDAPTGGMQVGEVLSPTHPVAGGLFAVQLDFGAVAFRGDARWLEIAVRCPAGTGNYEVLPMRHELSAVPYALGLRPGTRVEGAVPAGANFEAGLRVTNSSANYPIALFGLATATSGPAIGVAGNNRSPNGFGVFGYSSPEGTAVRGEAFGGAGVYGSSVDWLGVYGFSQNSHGVWGESPNGSGVVGKSTKWRGISGESVDEHGIFGKSVKGAGVVGHSESSGNPGVFARNLGSGPGIYATSQSGPAAVFAGTTRTNVLQITGGSDLAERFQVSDNLIPEPGTVMVIDAHNPGHLVPSNTAYDRKVAGVVSGAGDVETGLVLHQEGVLEGDTVVAIAGRVYVKAEALTGPITPGDLLTTSDLPGHAMAVTDYERAYGAVIGKAMTGLESGTGLVLVLVNLQ